MIHKAICLVCGILCLCPSMSWAQKEEKVHAIYTYSIGFDDNITLHDARLRSIELAKAEAIKAEFGELVTSDVIDTNGDYWENTVAKAKGHWLGDEKKTEVSVSVVDNRLLFKAEVWGWAREIAQAQTELQWKILGENGGETDEFQSRDHVYVTFRAPADGNVAIYLITGDDQTSCLLPYKHNPEGRHHITRNTDYVFFNSKKDVNALQYRLSTKQDVERNQLVIIYSPNPFTKCNEITGDEKHPNSLSTQDFQKWLLKCQREDKDMIVNKKWIKIHKDL